MKVFVDLTRFAATADRVALRDTVASLDDAGATGVTISDHLFYTREGRPRRDGVDPGCDPATTLAAVAAISDRLEVQTVVMNSAWLHPALLLRHFNQLAVLAGGERVTAGLGAGWSAEEFDAIGMTMPRFRTRMDRLDKVLALARELYDRGSVSTDGATSSLPPASKPDVHRWPCAPRSGTWPSPIQRPSDARPRKSCAPSGPTCRTAHWTAARTC
jgi:alkanesulfonate monooxygenase SsuD/methylene tetrahydromethanopterin reductase-like flavin-dependent oxidoreductase (luciferase family)